MKRYFKNRLSMAWCVVAMVWLLPGCNAVNPTLQGDPGVGAPSRAVPIQQLSPSPLSEGIYTGEIACSSLFTSSLFGELSSATATGPLTIVVGPNGIPVREPRGALNLAGLEFARIDQGIVVNTDSVMIASTIGFLFGDVTLEGASTLAIGLAGDGSLQIAISVLTIGVDDGEVFTLRDDCVGTITFSSSLMTPETP